MRAWMMGVACVASVAVVVVVGCFAVDGVARAADPTPAPTVPPADAQAKIDAEIAVEHFGSAVVLCELAQRSGELSLELKASCGKAYVGLGDKLLAAGSPENARQRWNQAVVIDPRLMDDADFVKRLKGGTAGSKPEPPPNNNGNPKGDGHTGVEPKPKPLPQKRLPLPEERTGPPANAGPRWDRTLGLGLSFGFDGLVALALGWLTDETVLVEVSFGIVYPAADVRVRWLGMRNCITPYVGVGLLVPFGETDRLGLGIGSYKSLYELGEAFHIDIGVAYTPVHRLDLYAGVAFMTPLDQDHPDTVLFFPQVSAGASWYF